MAKVCMIQPMMKLFEFLKELENWLIWKVSI